MPKRRRVRPAGDAWPESVLESPAVVGRSGGSSIPGTLRHPACIPACGRAPPLCAWWRPPQRQPLPPRARPRCLRVPVTRRWSQPPLAQPHAGLPRVETTAWCWWDGAHAAWIPRAPLAVAMAAWGACGQPLLRRSRCSWLSESAKGIARKSIPAGLSLSCSAGAGKLAIR